MAMRNYVLYEIIQYPHICVRVKFNPERLFGNINTVIYLLIFKYRYPVNQNISRQKLGQIVFHDPQQKALLESIIHPYVQEMLKKGIEQCQEPLVFLDVPLLYETHMDTMCDDVIVVYVDEKTQLKRLMKRNQIDEKQARLLMGQQISIEKKKEMGDYIIDNRQNFEDLYVQIERVLEVLKNEIIRH